MRVLVIDDEATLLAAARRVLGGAHQVTTAQDGASALALLAKESFDLVLCDLMLGDTEGVRVYEQAIAARPEIEPRFLFMTGGALTPRSLEFKESLGDRCLAKPFDADTLLEAVRLYGASLAGRRASRPPPFARVG